MPALPGVSELFDAAAWEEVPGFPLSSLADITYHRAVGASGRSSGTVRIAFDRPEVRNAFRPSTVDELYRCLDHARQTPDVGCVLITGGARGFGRAIALLLAEHGADVAIADIARELPSDYFRGMSDRERLHRTR